MNNKFCPSCQSEKPIDEFGKHAARKDGRQSICKRCDREKKNALYAKNPGVYKKLVKETKRRKAEWFANLKRGLKCSRCGDERWYLIEFHHRNDKNDHVSEMVSNNVGKSRILKEIEKCDPLCANCHKEVHYLSGNRGRNPRSRVED